MMSKVDETMSTLLVELKQLTIDLVSRLSFISEEELIDFVDQRGQLIERMESYRSSVNDQDQLILKELADMDPLILQKMNQFKEEAGNWLERQGVIKVQKNAYHQNFVTDSFFVDHRN